MNQRPAIPAGLFCVQEAHMNPIPFLAAIFVKTVLEWWLED